MEGVGVVRLTPVHAPLEAMGAHIEAQLSSETILPNEAVHSTLAGPNHMQAPFQADPSSQPFSRSSSSSPSPNITSPVPDNMGTSNTLISDSGYVHHESDPSYEDALALLPSIPDFHGFSSPVLLASIPTIPSFASSMDIDEPENNIMISSALSSPSMHENMVSTIQNISSTDDAEIITPSTDAEPNAGNTEGSIPIIPLAYNLELSEADLADEIEVERMLRFELYHD